MPLAITDQNAVWRRVYPSLGFTEKELEGFFSGLLISTGSGWATWMHGVGICHKAG